MTGKDWQVTIDFKAGVEIDEDALFDLMEEYGSHGAVAALGSDPHCASLTMTITAETGMNALSDALGLLSDSKTLPGTEVTGFKVTDWAEAEQRNREPVFPKVVGYAEIARMTGVSRQRAYKFPEIATFPKPVIKTSQGPLYSEAAVAAWAETRETKAGRPKTEILPSTENTTAPAHC